MGLAGTSATKSSDRIPSQQAPLYQEWVAIAALLRPQGRRGELLCEPLSDLPEIFAAGQSVVLAVAMPVKADDSRTVEAHWFPTGKNAGRVVLQLSGCESISEAETLAGRKAWIAAGELPGLDADTYFVGDLVGCTLIDGETPAGTVVDLEFPTGPDGRTRLEDAAPLLAIRLAESSDDAEPVLVPFVRVWLESVDVAARRIVMRLPEGLLHTLADDEDEGGGDDESQVDS